MAVGLVSNGAQVVGKLNKVSTTLPDSVRQGAGASGLAVKSAWLSIAGSNGLSPNGKIAGRKWGVNYQVRGGTGASTLVRYTGPVHLVVGRAKPHLLAARRLGTRKQVAGKAGRIGATAAFGGSNRGAFGKLRAGSRTSRSGATRTTGKQALTIGPNLRPYAFHPGIAGKPRIWTESKRVAAEIGPKVYTAETRKALAKAGLGTASSVLRGVS